MPDTATTPDPDTPLGPSATADPRPAPGTPAPWRRPVRPRVGPDRQPGRRAGPACVRALERAARLAAQAEVARLKAELAQQASRTEAENTHLRRDLIANVSHDLRTPLVSLRGYLEMLVTKGDALAGEQRAQYLAVALRQSDALARLIEELFDLARLDLPGTTLHAEAFAPLEFVGDVLQKFQIQAQKQDVGLDLDGAPDLPFASADLGLVERALDNLVGNALKHTPAGGSVRLALCAQAGRLEVAVSDTGCGIAADELPHVFDRCYRGSGPARAVAGAGLGLAIAQRIVALHGGRITVDSSPGEGARFAFTLPLA